MNHPDISKIIDEIGSYLQSGMKVYLNTDTGEIEYFFCDSYCYSDDNSEWEESFEKTVESWPNKMLFEPPESRESFRMMEDFIEDNVREGTPLYVRLSNAIRQRKPFARFKEEIHRCNGQKQWHEYKDRCYQIVVIDRIIDVMGMPFVECQDLSAKVFRQMAEAHLNRRYCYVVPRRKKVIISQVPDQTHFDYINGKVIERDTHYTIKEWAIERAEDRKFQRMGGGMVYEPIMPDDDDVTEEDRDIEHVIAKIKKGLSWVEAEQDDFDDYCLSQSYGETSAEQDFDYEFPTSNGEKTKRKFDGKYPIKGRPQDIFTDEDPWGNTD